MIDLCVIDPSLKFNKPVAKLFSFDKKIYLKPVICTLNFS